MLKITLNVSAIDITNALTNYVTKNSNRFKHVNAPNNTADIGILNSNTWAKSGDFPTVLKKFKSVGKYLNSQTLIYPAEGEKECHHLVILT